MDAIHAKFSYILQRIHVRMFRHRSRVHCIWAVVLLCVILVSIPHAQAQASTTLRCRVSQSTVGVGSDATLFIEMVDVTDLYGYELAVRYDIKP